MNEMFSPPKGRAKEEVKEAEKRALYQKVVFPTEAPMSKRKKPEISPTKRILKSQPSKDKPEGAEEEGYFEMSI